MASVLKKFFAKITIVSYARIAAFVLLIIFMLFLSTRTDTQSNGAAAEAEKIKSLRVISLYAGHSDNIAALGASNMLVGLSENDDSDLLPELPRFPLRTGAEALLALQPDIVLTRGLVTRVNPTLEQILTRAGVRVENIDTPDWDNFPEYLRRLAKILGIDPEAAVTRLNKLCAKIADRTREAQSGWTEKNLQAPRVFIEATAKELHTCAPKSWAAHLISLAGGINAASDAVPQREGSAIAPWGLERILKLLDSSDGQDTLDVYIIQQGAMNTSTLEDFKSRPWVGVFKNNNSTRIAAVPERFLSRPSLIGLEHGSEILLEIFYR